MFPHSKQRLPYPTSKGFLSLQELEIVLAEYSLCSLLPSGNLPEGCARARGVSRPKAGWGPRCRLPRARRAPPGRVPGAARDRRTPTCRPSPHARNPGLPPAGRVHAYLLCSGQTRLSQSPRRGQVALAIRSPPRPSSAPPGRAPAPTATTPNP